MKGNLDWLHWYVTQELEEPRLDERERAMDFATGTTVGPES
jgi:hypothetical protein